ncbi:nuclear transport factor 2 family protein [Streptomyces sp. NPDC052000]|uniref:nuclear transport factor 2 family protein n=1 Tax=Streptomyces sp. NPDC052000 TaxID=3155676 RepID=UPI0034500BAA
MLGLVAGRAAVLDFIRDGHTSQTGRVRHRLGNVVVTTTDAATAEVRAYLLQTRNTGESIQMISTGVYTFSLLRSDGRWRIAELTLMLDNALVLLQWRFSICPGQGSLLECNGLMHRQGGGGS